MRSRPTNPRVSLICATGSTAINSELRAELLWRMVNSAHKDPGYPFELILVDNTGGPGAHRDAIRQIADAYGTVTHVVQNRTNEFHGGGVRLGIMVADGDLLVQITDDLELKPGWLHALIAPLREDPRERLVGALLKGHNCGSKLITRFDLNDRAYELRTAAAAYCWAFWRTTVDALGTWKRAHFADTRWCRKLQVTGFRFVLPSERYAVETNLNFLRPWDYESERGLAGKAVKYERLDALWESGRLLEGAIELPPEGRPLKNPDGIGPREREAYAVWVARIKEELWPTRKSETSTT